MLTDYKKRAIRDAKSLLRSNIPAFRDLDLSSLEEHFLFVNFYDYLSTIPYDQRAELERQLKALKRLNRDLSNNNIITPALYPQADRLQKAIRSYILKFPGVLSPQLPKLAFPIYAHLVRLVELFSDVNSQIDWTLNMKVDLATYLLLYVRIRKGSNDYDNDVVDRNFDPRTYNKYKSQLESNPDNYLVIDAEAAKCQVIKTKKLAQRFVKREREKSPRAYFPEVRIR